MRPSASVVEETRSAKAVPPNNSLVFLSVASSAFAILLVEQAVRRTVYAYRAKDAAGWHKADVTRVTKWARVAISGIGDSRISVDSFYGTFVARPEGKVMRHTDEIPIPDIEGAVLVVLTVQESAEKVVVDLKDVADKEGGQRLFGTYCLQVEFVVPCRRWVVAEDFSATALPNGGVLMRDVSAPPAAREIVFLPGMNEPFRSRDTLLHFRAAGFRVNVFYYESHTFARKEGVADCSFPSGSLTRSLSDLEVALSMTKARVVLGYSLGGLILAAKLARKLPLSGRGTFEDQVDVAVFLAPFVSFRKTPLENVDSDPFGEPMLSALRAGVHRERGTEILVKSRTNRRLGFTQFEYPLEPEPAVPNECPISYSFVCATSRAIREIKTSVSRRGKIRTRSLIVVPTMDRVVDPSAMVSFGRSCFEDVTTEEVFADHTIWPCRSRKDDQTVRDVVTRFLRKGGENGGRVA